jgi:hypothetical protein
MAADVARAREIIRTALDASPAIHAVLEAKADSWVHRLIPAIAQALAAARAEGVAQERARWEAIAAEVANHPAHTKCERRGARMVGATARDREATP